MNLSAIINQLISLFLMMFMGYAVARAGIMTPEFRARLSSFNLNTAAPCIILSSVLQSSSSAGEMLGALGTAALYYVLMILFAAVVVRLLRTPREQRGWDQLMLIFTNVGFMGIPVVQSIYGAEGVAMLSMFILMFNIFFFSYGVVLISSGAKFNLRALLNACIFAALLGLVFGMTGWRLPAPVESTLAAVGAMNTPLAMMIIGASLAHSDVRAAITNKRLYRVGLISMLVMPMLVFLALRFLPISPMLIGVATVCAAMPIGGNCAMIADVYAPGDLTASHAVILTTLACGATLPLVCAVMSALM